MARRFNAQKKKKNRQLKQNIPPRVVKSTDTTAKTVIPISAPVYSMSNPVTSRTSPATSGIEATRYENLSSELKRVFIVTALVLVLLFILWAILR